MASNSSVAYSTFSGAFSMPLSKRKEIFPPSDTPSPQEYGFLDLNASKYRSPKWKISESKKISVFDVKNRHPSPGSYEVPSFITDGASCRINNIQTIEKPPTKTSPATYTPNFSLVKETSPQIGLTLRASPDMKKTFEETPGPGAYEHKIHEISNLSQKIKTKGKLNIFGMSNKCQLQNKDLSRFPAPNSYSVQDELTRSPSPAFKFQQSQRTELINTSYEQNGPAMYNTSLYLQKKRVSPSSSEKQSQMLSHTLPIQNANKSLNDSNFPGPGSYFNSNSTLPQSSRSIKFGSSQRLKQMAETTKTFPGPGQYNIFQDPKLPNFSHNTFGEAKKKPSFEPSLSPGPGQYFLQPKIGEGPKYGIGGSSSLSSFIPKSSVPGPGQYPVNDKLTRPSPSSVKFNSKIDQTKLFQNPGPGSYDPKNETFRTSKISFASNTIRDPFSCKAGPSPGDYEIHSQFAGLPSYHHKQLNYFNNKIKKIREKPITSNSSMNKSQFQNQNMSQDSYKTALSHKDE